ncbi:7689_t:CDS:2, partial [Dentiscutata heterogama]
LEKDEKIKKALKQYSDNEELQRYMEYGMKLKYHTKLLETAKKQIADEIIPWGNIYEDWDIDELLAKI